MARLISDASPEVSPDGPDVEFLGFLGLRVF